jgi:hypothetical protein
MRGADEKQEAMFSYISPEKRVPSEHPLRPIRGMVDAILKEMSPRFDRLYAKVGRPSIAPDRLLRALGVKVGTGEFRVMMDVELVNDGPVTLLLDSEKLL